MPANPASAPQPGRAPLQNRNILISGAGIAGPALAYWLRRYGFTPTVVERAPELRGGGFAVDFRGAAHLQVLERMGLLEEVRQRQTHMGAMTVVDDAGRALVSLPPAFASGEVEIARGDLSRLLYERTRDSTEYVFGDSLTSLTETSEGVQVTFERGRPRTFDLVVGADGLHSKVRALAFGEESKLLHFLGFYVAAFTTSNLLQLERTNLLFNTPGRLASIASARDRSRADVLFVFASERLDDERRETAQHKDILAETFAGMGWEVPRLLGAMREAPDLYFDSLSQVRMDCYSKGRVVLLGDAGYGATCGGLGTGLAVVCAHVLAGELAAAGGEHRTAFSRYEAQVRDYARGCQKLAEGAGPFLAPPTASSIWRRNLMYRMLTSRPLAGFLNKLTTRAASAISLPDYPG